MGDFIQIHWEAFEILSSSKREQTNKFETITKRRLHNRVTQLIRKVLPFNILARIIS